MPSAVTLKKLAALRLREAEALFQAKLYDGAAYLCGYVVEVALKARICKVMKVRDYEDLFSLDARTVRTASGKLLRVEAFKKHVRVASPYKTHEVDKLLLLAGLDQELHGAGTTSALFRNWSLASDWKPEGRYDAPGTRIRKDVEDRINALRADPDGVFTWIRKHW